MNGVFKDVETYHFLKIRHVVNFVCRGRLGIDLIEARLLLFHICPVEQVGVGVESQSLGVLWRQSCLAYIFRFSI